MLIMSYLSSQCENSCDQCDFVLAFGSLSDDVKNSCLYARFGVGRREKMQKIVYVSFFRAQGRKVQLWGPEFHGLTHPPLLINTSGYCFCSYNYHRVTLCINCTQGGMRDILSYNTNLPS